MLNLLILQQCAGQRGHALAFLFVCLTSYFAHHLLGGCEFAGLPRVLRIHDRTFPQFDCEAFGSMWFTTGRVFQAVGRVAPAAG